MNQKPSGYGHVNGKPIEILEGYEIVPEDEVPQGRKPAGWRMYTIESALFNWADTDYDAFFEALVYVRPARVSLELKERFDRITRDFLLENFNNGPLAPSEVLRHLFNYVMEARAKNEEDYKKQIESLRP